MNLPPDYLNRLVERICALQQIPAPTFAEEQRARQVAEWFRQEGLRDVDLDEVGNVYGCWPGRADRPPLVVCAHLDSVFPMDTPLTLQTGIDRISGPGIGDNATGLGGLFGLLWLLQANAAQWPGHLWLVGTVGEEGLGDLRGMRAVLERIPQPLAVLVVEGMGLGQIFHRGLGSRRYRIACQTGGGHSWIDYGRPSAIHELVRLATAFTDLPIPAHPRTSLNIGTISGGTSVNSIAAKAALELDLRSENPNQLQAVVDHIEALVQSANREGVQFSSQVIGNRPAGGLTADHPLVRLAIHTLDSLGIHAQTGIGSTDANIPLSRHIPAVCVGLTRGGGAHTTGEYIHISPLQTGMRQLWQLTQGVWTVLE